MSINMKLLNLKVNSKISYDLILNVNEVIFKKIEKKNYFYIIADIKIILPVHKWPKRGKKLKLDRPNIVEK